MLYDIEKIASLAEDYGMLVNRLQRGIEIFDADDDGRAMLRAGFQHAVHHVFFDHIERREAEDFHRGALRTHEAEGEHRRAARDEGLVPGMDAAAPEHPGEAHDQQRHPGLLQRLQPGQIVYRGQALFMPVRPPGL